MEHYILLSSDGYKKSYPTNTPYHFYADLSEELKLDNRWKVGLAQLVQNREQDMFVYSNISQECYVNDTKKTLLRYLNTKDDINSVYYHYVKVYNIHRQIEITLRLRDGSFPEHLVEPSIVLLHFKRYPV
jgi:hypothetical protein